MADLYNYVIPQGLIIPDTSTIQAAVTAEYTSVFGLDLITTPNSPAGLLITAETAARSAVVNNNAAVANQINPYLAGGVYLDAIMALTGVQRVAQTYTTVTADITGVPGTFIAAGSLASETVNQAQFRLRDNVTIPAGGVTTGVFVAVLPGAIPCAATTLTQIVSDLIGWLTVNNPLAGTLGALAQSDQQALILRNTAIGVQGAALANAIIGNVALLPGYNSMTFRENVASTTQVIDGVTMVSHSLYACVSAASETDLAIATAIAQKKSGGCAYNNGASATPVSQVVVQPVSGQGITVKFDRPDMISCIAQVTVSQGSAITPDLQAAVKQACYNYAQGVGGKPGALVVGADLSAFELAGAITAAIPGIYVSNLQVSLATPVSLVNVVVAEIWEQNYFANTNAITVVII